MCRNLYVHFPFCRRKCTYCALHSRAGSTPGQRTDYVASLAARIPALAAPADGFDTVYFGGGSPALCPLGPLFDSLRPLLASAAEFTVELHPLDVTEPLLAELQAGGVNRISMGVQSLDDAVLRDMGRGYTADEARRAFDLVRRHFDNAGIDIIVGYPADRSVYSALRDWGLRHCSVYSLILEEHSILSKRSPALPDDDETLDRLAAVAELLAGFGLERYEISNYAVRGCECRHNLAVWRGEDYCGLGEGAAGRIGRVRTMDGKTTETVDEATDRRERTLFRLRTREGLDTTAFPEWRPVLERFVAEGLLVRLADAPFVYRLTPRGTEVCDSILAELV